MNLPNEFADNTSTSESEKEIDIFDLDFPNLDVFGANFSFSELLVDFDLDGEEVNHSSGSMMEASGRTMLEYGFVSVMPLAISYISISSQFCWLHSPSQSFL